MGPPKGLLQPTWGFSVFTSPAMHYHGPYAFSDPNAPPSSNGPLRSSGGPPDMSRSMDSTNVSLVTANPSNEEPSEVGERNPKRRNPRQPARPRKITTATRKTTTDLGFNVIVVRLGCVLTRTIFVICRNMMTAIQITWIIFVPIVDPNKRGISNEKALVVAPPVENNLDWPLLHIAL